ncbi:MAG: hypothetical protein RR734_03895 [Bacilli bacterium]
MPIIGDILKQNLFKLKNATQSKNGKNAFWIILRDIAKEDIINVYPNKVDSDIIVPIYYDILSKNRENIPLYFQETLYSNNQERFRVINRNLFTSNAFHPEGLANQEGIKAKKALNEFKKGNRIIYQGEIRNDH